MATIKEIAELAKVSATTVSRTLNQDKTLSISDQKRQLVIEIADELGYKTRKERSKEKRKVVKQRRSVGLLLLYSQQEELNDPYYLSIRHAIENESAQCGFKIVEMFYNSDTSKVFKKNTFDELIVVGSQAHYGEIDCEKMFINIKNVIFVDFNPEVENADSIIMDFEKSVIKAITYLTNLGHKKIGYIGGEDLYTLKIKGPYPLQIEDVRKTVFYETMKSKKIFNENYIRVGGMYSSEQGYDSIKDIIDKGKVPTALFIASDTMAIGVLKALYESGIKVPEEVAIIGCNDIKAAEFLLPALTTIKANTELMGSMAVRLMKERLEYDRDLGVSILIPTKLIVRESSELRK